MKVWEEKAEIKGVLEGWCGNLMQWKCHGVYEDDPNEDSCKDGYSLS